MVIILWLIVILALLARVWVVAAIMAVAAIGLGEWRKHRAQTMAISPSADDEYQKSFRIDLTNDILDKNSGWHRWTMYPAKRRLESSFCAGGPPAVTDVWEYRLEATSVYVRLLESSEEEFAGKRYRVFGK